jgi:hypothetical protein
VTVEAAMSAAGASWTCRRHACHYRNGITLARFANESYFALHGGVDENNQRYQLR